MTTALATTKLSKQQDELLTALLKDKSKSIQISIPDEADPQTILNSVRSCCSMVSKIEDTSGRLMAVLGRLMVVIRKNPEIWKLAGYKSYEQFVLKEIEERHGLSRASLWAGKRIIEKFPNLTIKEYGDIGTQKLTLLAKYVSMESPGHQKWLAKASEVTHEKLKEVLEDKFSDHGGNTGATLTITGSKAKVKQIKKFLERLDIQAAAESADPIEIILAMMMEVTVEWIEKGEAALKEKAAQEEAEAAA